jgi:hypothetical protein
MKNKLYFAVGILLLVGSFALSNRSTQVFAGGGNPMPPCPPQGCTMPPT